VELGVEGDLAGVVDFDSLPGLAGLRFFMDWAGLLDSEGSEFRRCTKF
jgi:hypothetical protein